VRVAPDDDRCEQIADGDGDDVAGAIAAVAEAEPLHSRVRPHLDQRVVTVVDRAGGEGCRGLKWDDHTRGQDFRDVHRHAVYFAQILRLTRCGGAS
jgi:hypothetical protein